MTDLLCSIDGGVDGGAEGRFWRWQLLRTPPSWRFHTGYQLLAGWAVAEEVIVGIPVGDVGLELLARYEVWAAYTRVTQKRFQCKME